MVVQRCFLVSKARMFMKIKDRCRRGVPPKRSADLQVSMQGIRGRSVKLKVGGKAGLIVIILCFHRHSRFVRSILAFENDSRAEN